MAKSLLLISRQSPWSGPGAREALDIVLAGGAFDLPIGLLFLDDGVLQLLAGQDARAVQQKDLSANLQALPMFGVEALFVCADSAARRGIDTAALALDDMKVLTAQDITALIDRYDQVITL
ncbi:tRNA 2-thiouridine synthesizing protein C [Pseudomonas sp. NFACC32-1]|uniref:sulfurtransferase complex subunit TusC n=1 Tax=unclassified Pseudomonas TaxID=196821 RepID=UPI0008768948|nr:MULTISPECIES: sulfurtransferase complex subunit TusC [unclassified Pseudomonas]MDB6444772.1 sulfurtransferase complex subunit TusC [Pseudomonas sp. 21TX0197]ROO33306.1 sulfurtransferase TusC [Pseudomonas sp. 7SR1]SCX51911.1 tRNA 2-thiouridine synthesizing protein C [Pseudomonas sp. NFACC32-1]SFX47677.1 tRNA 2-thiouridine synthesizing protein C [Pseudomonas sp. NFACC36]SIS23794.1 tRNA 2-thiouridine synthesizing protein C [Pseudomonas sp. 7SR1]